VSASQAGMRELALGLAEALRPALVAGAPPIAAVAARDVAQLMGLTGLEAALAELARHPNAPWPLEVELVAERVARMADAAASEGDLSGFHGADRELGALAAQLAAAEWSEPLAATSRGVATIAADEAFAELALQAAPDALRTRMTMTVASAVRAAVDWLGADECPRVTLDVHDSALTLSVEAKHSGGIGPAGAVLAAVEGSLGREADGRWTIRVATSTERASYLLLRQGRYGVALPWHSVARLRMFARHELDRLVEPRLAPLSTGPASAGEQPAALVALGLARAWFVADRIVWRIAARAEEADVAGPFAGSSRVVAVENGERYWVLDPAWLLRGVAPPDVPPPSPRPRANTTTLEALPGPAAVPARPAPPVGESLAESVERALAQLRLERGADAAPVVNDAPREAGQPAEPAGRAGSPAWSGEMAVDAMMFSAHVDVLLPALDTPDMPDTPEPAVIDAPPVATLETPAPVVAPPAVDALDDAPVAELLDSLATQAPTGAVVPPSGRAAVADTPGGFPGAERETARAQRPSEVAARVPLRRALVADDSLVARIFLARLLEKRGWIVETVPDAASLWDELHRGPWALVCADFAMPDAQGAGHVARLVNFLGRRPAPTPCIVLTRDASDEVVAHEAGARLVLRKPFDPGELDMLLPR
jgi:CheY-like chemotaxis protein